MTDAPSATPPAAASAVTLNLEQVSALLAQAARNKDLSEFEKLLPAFKAAAEGQNQAILAKEAVSIIYNFSEADLRIAKSGIERLFAAMLEIGGADLVGSTYSFMRIRKPVDFRLCAIWAQQYFTNVPKGQVCDDTVRTQNMFSDLIRAADFSDHHAAALDALTQREPNWPISEDFLAPIREFLKLDDARLTRSVIGGPEYSQSVGLVQYLLRGKKHNLGQILTDETAVGFMRAVFAGGNVPLLYEHPSAKDSSVVWLPEMVKMQADSERCNYLPLFLNVARREKIISTNAVDPALATFINCAPAINPKPGHYRALDILLNMCDSGTDADKPIIDTDWLYRPISHTALAHKPWIAETLRQRGLLKSLNKFTPHLVSYAKPVAIAVISAALGAAAVFGGQWLLGPSSNAPAPTPTQQVEPAKPQSAAPALPAAVALLARQNTIVL